MKTHARFIIAGLIAICPIAAPCAHYPVPDLTYAGAADGIARVAFDVADDDGDYAYTGVALASGQLVLAGLVRANSLNQYDFGFSRLTASGTPDTTFGGANSGRMLAGLTPVTGVRQILHTPDGHLLYVGATSTSTGVIARMDDTGAADPSFNGNGLRFLGAGFFIDAGTTLVLSGVVTLPGGKILVAGYAGSATTICAAAARFNADGSTDTTFGAGRGSVCVAPAMQSTPAAGAYTLAVLADARILLVGTAYHSGGSGTDMSVARLMPDGAIDTTFGPAHDGWGFAAFDQGGGLGDNADAVAIDSSGRIVLAGQVEIQGGYNVGVARLLSDGTTDTSFGTHGLVQLDFGLGGAANDAAHSVFVLPDRHILIGGWSQENAVVGTAAMLTSSGQLEYRFGNQGLFLQADPEGSTSEILDSQHMELVGDYMYMIGSIQSPVTNNIDFGAARFALPLFSDDFEVNTP